MSDTGPASPPQPTGTTRVPEYDIEKELGRGGMGVVYLARQHGTNRTVALKMLLAGGDVARFLYEAEVVAAIKHPNVVEVYHFGESDGSPFLALEYVRGGSFADYLKLRARLEPQEAAGFVARIAAGVQAAHALGIVHRDLKPGNILLTEADEPKVADFGLAKWRKVPDRTKTGDVMGTPAYMAPEQAQNTKQAGPPADVYALGVILYRCLTGRLPFEAENQFELMLKVVREEQLPVRSLARGVPIDLELVVNKCLQKAPAARYPTAGELAKELELFLSGEPVSERPPGRAEKAIRWVRKHQTPVAVYGLTLLAAILLGLTSGAVWLW